ncbi:CpaF/VirB11 family protein [Acetobacterium sp.]|uniref:CpaF/VirB11 family protein n=1 Tax=Acetobacterium sp. TaxID=1872094 RepID=UPI002F41D845
MINTVQKLDRNEELAKVVGRCQTHIRTNFPLALTNNTVNERNIKSFIEKFVKDHKVTMVGFTGIQLINRVYWEMVEYSVITPYLNDKDVEEININSWDAIKIHRRNGTIETLADGFLSATHARDIIIRLLQAESEVLLDEEKPIVRGHLKNNIRISASSTPVLDAIRGVQASIRIINPGNMKRRDFIRHETLTSEMFAFLSICLSHEVSMCITGATNSGKTTLMSGILGEVPKDQRIITIEEETREFDLVHRNADGVIDNNVVQWVTFGEYDMKRLLEQALTNTPRIICMAEMKSDEAYSAQEAARTGHAVITTTHADSCRATYKRIITLCKLTSDMDYDTLFDLVTEAFPIIVFTKKLKNNTRKVMEITECIHHDDARSITIQTLYEYDIERNDIDADGQPVITGRFVKRNNISKSLQRRFAANGVPTNLIESLLRGTVE